MLSRKTNSSNSSKNSRQGSQPSSATQISPSILKKPSSKLNPHAVNNLVNPKHKTTFSSVYAKGGIPCYLIHGSVKHKLGWNQPIASLNYDPLMMTMLEGLKETAHPYTFVVRQGLKEMLEAPNAEIKVKELMPKLIPPLRSAMACKKVKEIYLGAVNCIQHLSLLMGPQLNKHLPLLLPSLGQTIFDSNLSPAVNECLQLLEQQGGQEAFQLIKAKIPTYTSIFL